MNHEEYEWENEEYAIREHKKNNAPFPDILPKFSVISLAKDHSTLLITEDES